MPPPPDSIIPPPAPSPRGASRSALPFVLSGAMVVIYFAFVLLVAYDKPLLGRTLVPGLSWGILLGAVVIICAWLLTLVYVAVSNAKEGKK